jgi:hypothetical protein
MTDPDPKIPHGWPKGVKLDPYYEAACRNAKEAARRLFEEGIVDGEGRRIRTDLPPDMQPGSNRDFGG